MKPESLDLIYRVAKPFVFAFDLDAEKMHEIAIRQISKSKNKVRIPENLSVDLFGHHFVSPLMLAAGFDKNGLIVDKVSNFGFSAEVVGSVTAKRSDGNPRPRLWRLLEQSALLNRMGLNNDGAEAIAERLKGKSGYAISIAKTHDPNILGDKAIDDFLFSYNLLKNYGVYTEINISCPNTKEGKTFENPEDLETLLDALLSQGKGTPLLIKLSPNLSYFALQELVEVADEKVDGYVATNTLPYNHQVLGRAGYSGYPLRQRSLDIIRMLRVLTKKPVIGVGGIFNGKDAFEALKAGADLLQGFSGWVYRGPLYPIKLAKELSDELKLRGIKKVSDIKNYNPKDI